LSRFERSPGGTRLEPKFTAAPFAATGCSPPLGPITTIVLASPAGKKAGLYWKDRVPARVFGAGSRLLWFGRDPAWENVLGFRGKNDVAKRVGPWNTLVVTLKGDTVIGRLNGVTLSQATHLGMPPGEAPNPVGGIQGPH
jgi:hypothetical protein